jgi:hypothetical protein
VPGCGSQVCGQHFMSNFIQYNDDSHKLMHSTLGTPNVQSHMNSLIVYLQGAKICPFRLIFLSTHALAGPIRH